MAAPRVRVWLGAGAPLSNVLPYRPSVVFLCWQRSLLAVLMGQATLAESKLPNGGSEMKQAADYCCETLSSAMAGV